MAISKENRLNIYGALAGGAALVVVSILDYKNSLDLRTDPRARPLSFTSEDFKRFYDGEFNNVQEDVERIQQWIVDHNKWGRDLAGQNRAEIDNMQNDIKSLQDQILYLYRQELPAE